MGEVKPGEDRIDHVSAKDALERTQGVLDLRGLKCPLPAIRTAKALAAGAPGTVLTVIADDPLAPLDIAHLCAVEGHEILAREGMAVQAVRFTIRRGGAAAG